MRKWIRTVAVALVLVLVFMLLGLRVAHPKSGLNSAVGSAKSTLVVYKKADTFLAGQRLLVNTGDRNVDPVVSIARTVGEGTVDVQTDRMLVQVSDKDVQGRIVALFPFIGGLFSAFGL